MCTTLVLLEPGSERLKRDLSGELDVDVSMDPLRFWTYFQAPRDIRDFGLICDLFNKIQL